MTVFESYGTLPGLKEAQEAADSIRTHLAESATSAIVPEIAMVLGSGLGDVAEAIADPVIIPYEDIKHFPVSTAMGHKGRLVTGTFAGKPVVAMQGRFHLFEGWHARHIALPIRTFKCLGIRSLILTNAAGGLNPSFSKGSIMRISDHLNLTGHDPTFGPNDELIGPRFTDLSEAWSKTLGALAKKAALEAQVKLEEGVYVGLAGPVFETSAERRYLAGIGADAVGMSTVMENIAANHCGLPAVGFSMITNMAMGGDDQEPDSGEEVLTQAGLMCGELLRLFQHLVPKL